MPDGFAEAMFAQGWFASAWVGRDAPARIWITCRRRRPLAGSVLLGPGPDRARAATRHALQAFLPPDWEIVAADGEREPAAFDRAFAASHGELIWLLRAGAQPDAAWFDAARRQTLFAPAAPGGGATQPGDVCGLMLPRLERLLAGPFGDQASDTIAYEELGLRLEANARAPQPIAGAFATPPPAAASPDSIAREGAALLADWRLVAGGEAGDGGHRAPEIEAPWGMRAPRISLCMIAKNEERFLDECLRRAAPAADEILLVDTGSTDATVAIAERHGARVLHRPWTDDFAAPRNAGIEAAGGDWILVLDADEYLEDGAAARIRELVRDPGVAGWHLRFDNVYTNHRSAGVLMVRLFQRLPGVRYENRIHEQVTPSLQRAAAAQGLILAVSDVTVAHYGYTDEVMAGKRKNERNDRLFAQHLAERPDDVYMLYKYGDFLRRMPERLPQARATLERALALLEAQPPSAPLEVPYAGEISALVALEYARIDDRAAAEAIVERALRRFLPTPNLHYIAASLALHAGRPDEAIAHFERCLDYRGQVLVVPIQDGVDSWIAVTGIAQAWLAKGDRAKARRLLADALALNPAHETAVITLSSLCWEEGDPAEALGLLARFLAEHPDAPAACQQTMAMLGRLGHRDQARRVGQHAVQLLERRGLGLEAEKVKAAMASIR
jgi:glycosyltransferase involved in cell wall biosynthesis